MKCTMKKIVFAATMFAISTSGAWAAPPAGAPGWTGTYGGFAGGYGWGHSDQTEPGIPVLPTIVITDDDGHYSAKGGLLGGTWGTTS
jgi:opacity protein-like surface antigen